jgi:hypothetical protein
MNERVIFDEAKGIYFFIHNSITYLFSLGEPEPSPGEPEP